MCSTSLSGGNRADGLPLGIRCSGKYSVAVKDMSFKIGPILFAWELVRAHFKTCFCCYNFEFQTTCGILTWYRLCICTMSNGYNLVPILATSRRLCFSRWWTYIRIFEVFKLCFKSFNLYIWVLILIEYDF